MSDREMLELAAKAAGLNLQDWRFVDNLCYTGLVLYFNEETTINRWNPLEDDGDCARMECALELGINISDFNVTVTGKGGVYVDEYYKHHYGDKDKARRYASTRLAAEIGKAMP